MLSRTLRAGLAAAIVALSAGGALAQTTDGPATVVQNATLGAILADPAGKTLYSWDRDTAGVSTCYDQCAVNWPPFFAADGATATGEWTIVTRTDGTHIWAYDGMPLYYFLNDAAAGDTNGNQPTGTWHVVPAT